MSSPKSSGGECCQYCRRCMYMCIVIKLVIPSVSTKSLLICIITYPLNSEVHDCSTAACCCRCHKCSYHMLRAAYVSKKNISRTSWTTNLLQPKRPRINKPDNWREMCPTCTLHERWFRQYSSPKDPKGVNNKQQKHSRYGHLDGFEQVDLNGVQ